MKTIENTNNDKEKLLMSVAEVTALNTIFDEPIFSIDKSDHSFKVIHKGNFEKLLSNMQG